MNSIFVRMYGGILAALLIIGVITYAGVNLVNQYRSELYRENMARGTFYLMAQGYQTHTDAAARQYWTHRLSESLGAQVVLVDAAQLDLSYREKLYLDEGRVVFRAARGRPSGAVQVIYALPGGALYMSVVVSRLSEQQARTTALLVRDYLAPYPVAQWPAKLAHLNRHFGYPLSLSVLTDPALSTDQRHRLGAGEIVFALSSSSRYGTQVRVFAPLSGDQTILVLGPARLFDPFPWQLLVIAGAIALILVALTTWLQVRPLQIRLQRLNQAVKRLGGGDLAAHAPISGSDPIAQVAVTFNGMTAHIRRLIEAQREMTRAVSHELRTPVARLRFGLEMLADCESIDERRGKLNDLDRDIDQLDHLIDEILTYARLEEGTPNIDFQTVQPWLICQQLIDELDAIRGNIVIDAVGERDIALQSDPRYLHRVLQNLVTNALRYARGRVRVVLSAVDDTLIVDVDDDGPGIPVHQRELVFKPFARLDKSRHRASGGYGLGLSIVKRIVDWHGGEVRVEQSPWGGARFRVILPREQPEQHVLIRDQRPFS